MLAAQMAGRRVEQRAVLTVYQKAEKSDKPKVELTVGLRVSNLDESLAGSRVASMVAQKVVSLDSKWVES